MGYSAMKRILSKYGTYTHHLAGLSVDHSIKSVDRAKLKGYSLHWTNAKYILGCTLFTDYTNTMQYIFNSYARR